MENKVVISSLASSLAQTTGKSKKLCEDFLREFFKMTAETLETGEAVKIKGFGTFKIIEVESRTGVNVTTGEKHQIPSYKKVSFNPAKDLASAINSPFEQFQSVEIDDDMPEDIIMDEEITPEDKVETESEVKAASLIEKEIGDENNVSEERLEVGSEEETSDDDITYEAYKEIEEEPVKESVVSIPPISSAEEESGVEDETIRAAREEEKTEETSDVREVQLPVYYERRGKNRFGIGFLTGALCALLVCVIIFMLGCFFDWWPMNFGDPKSDVIVKEAQEVPVDTQLAGLSDDVNDEGAETSVPEKEPVYDMVSTTRYLTTIARDHYGNFNFWPYIYLENEKILGHPDRITPGTKVVVPDLGKYGVDPSNKNDVATAKKKGLEIYSKFK